MVGEGRLRLSLAAIVSDRYGAVASSSGCVFVCVQLYCGLYRPQPSIYMYLQIRSSH